MNGDKKPLISIIVPSFNEEKHISRCLDSILNQTFTDFEVLCVDDNSTDRTFEIIKEYSQKDSRIIPLKNPGKGVSSARNFGLERVNGDYIGFVDSDDFIQPQMYEFLYRAITENGSNLAFCDYIEASELNIENFSYTCCLSKTENFITFNDFSLKKEAVIGSVWNKLFKKSILKGITFKKYRIGEDLNFCAQVFSKEKSFSYVDLPLYNYYQNPDSTCHIGFKHEKWFDLIESKFNSYEVLSDDVLGFIYLKENYRFIIPYKYEIRDNRDIVKKINSFAKKYFIKYLFCKYIPVKERIYSFVFLKFNFLYHLYRFVFNFKNKD